MSMTDLDFSDIRSLFARYSQCLDFADADGFAACFTDEGALVTTWPQDGLAGEHRGPEALRSFATASNEYHAGRVRQTAAVPVIEGDGRTARATAYVILTRDYGPPEIPGDLTHAELLTTAIYLDELVKTPDGWRFALREFLHDGTAGVLSRVGAHASAGPG